MKIKEVMQPFSKATVNGKEADIKLDKGVCVVAAEPYSFNSGFIKLKIE